MYICLYVLELKKRIQLSWISFKLDSSVIYTLYGHIQSLIMNTYKPNLSKEFYTPRMMSIKINVGTRNICYRL